MTCTSHPAGPGCTVCDLARAGLDIIHEVGPSNIAGWVHALSARMAHGGREHGLVMYGPTSPDQKAPTTAFWVGNDSHTIEHRMRERGVVASARGSVIRLAPHFYSTFEDVDRALDVLATVLHDQRSSE